MRSKKPIVCLSLVKRKVKSLFACELMLEGTYVSSPAKRERKGAHCACNGIGEGKSEGEPRPLIYPNQFRCAKQIGPLSSPVNGRRRRIKSNWQNAQPYRSCGLRSPIHCHTKTEWKQTCRP